MQQYMPKMIKLFGNTFLKNIDYLEKMSFLRVVHFKS